MSPTQTDSPRLRPASMNNPQDTASRERIQNEWIPASPHAGRLELDGLLPLPTDLPEWGERNAAWEAGGIAQQAVEFADFIQTMWNPSLTSEQLKASYALGLCGEAKEAKTEFMRAFITNNKANHRPEEAKKEAGDCLHYLFGLGRLYGFDTRETALAICAGCEGILATQNTYEVIFGTSYWSLFQDAACDVGDIVKKNLFHGKPFESVQMELRACLIAAGVYLMLGIDRAGYAPKDMMIGNVVKLQARHGKTFSTEYYAAQAQK